MANDTECLEMEMIRAAVKASLQEASHTPSSFHCIETTGTWNLQEQFFSCFSS